MSLFEKAMRQVEMYGRRGWSAAQNSALANIIRKDRERGRDAEEQRSLARRWGRLNFHSTVRYVPKEPAFVHCHECRWPVNAGRTHMLLGNEQRTEATEEQMQRICDGVRRQMGLM